MLTAWSIAGIIGPVVVNYIREAQLAAGVPRDHLYNTTMSASPLAWGVWITLKNAIWIF